MSKLDKRETSNDADEGSQDGGYVCYYKASDPDLRFQTEFKPVLIDTEAKFHEITDKIEGVTLAVDTETNTLEPDGVDPLVGCSFSTSDYDGFYLPFRHLVGTNLPIRMLKDFDKFLRRNSLLMFNAPFDLMMLERDGIADTEAYKLFEVMVLVFNADTNIKRNGLKDSAKHFLGRKSPTFEEMVGKNGNFAHLSPQEALYYAASDSANTFGLFRKLYTHLKAECPMTLKIDNFLSKVMPYYLANEINIDCAVMAEMAAVMKEKIRQLERQIFKTVGYPFQCDSKRQLGQALLSIGLDTGIQTEKSGEMKLDEESLKNVDHPVAKAIVERNSLVKQVSSYVQKLSTVSKGRINYHIWRVPTGRFASGNKDLNYYLHLNYQNLTKAPPAYYRVEESADSDSVLGWKFILVEKKEMDTQPGKYVEGFSPEENVRRAITVPDKEWVFCGFDYVQEELHIAAMLSRDPVMMEAFRSGQDLHKVVAVNMFGAENYDSAKRKKAKIANFGLLYDGCLRGSVRVLTDKGNIPVGDLPEKVVVWNTEGWVEGRKWCSGTKKVFRWWFEDRSYLDLTEGHNVFYLDGGKVGFAEIGSLPKGAQFLIPGTPDVDGELLRYDSTKDPLLRHSAKTTPFIFGGNSYDLWWSLGLLMGDGWLMKRAGKIVGVNWLLLPFDIEENERLDRFLVNLGLPFTKKVVLGKGRTQKLNCYNVCSVGFGSFLMNVLGLGMETKFPEAIWGQRKALVSGFINGFYTADGDRDGTIQISQNKKVGEDRIRKVQKLLRFLGVVSTYWKTDSDKYERHFLNINSIGEFKEAVGFKYCGTYSRFGGLGSVVDVDTAKAIYRRIKSKPEWKRMSCKEKIGSGVYELSKERGVSLGRLSLLAKRFGVEFLEGYSMVRLVGKEELGEELVYDIEIVSGKKAYLADGLLVHNTKYTLQKSSGLPINECQDIYTKYWETMKGLKNWKRQQVSMAYQRGGVCQTAFGRPRRLAWYLSNPLDKWKKFGERSVTSHIVQGTAADVMRVVMYKLRMEILKTYEGGVRFVGCVHDEQDLVIRKEVFNEVVPKIIELMGITVPGCSMPLQVGLEVGYCYGLLFPFRFDLPSGKWTPGFL